MNTLTQSVITFLEAYKIPVAEGWLEETIESHPDFPSLLSVSETLSLAGIHCLIQEVEPDAVELITYPALFHLHTDDVLLLKHPDAVEAAGLRQWTGVVINISNESTALSRSYSDAVRKERKARMQQRWFYAAGIAVLLLLFIQQPSTERAVLGVLALFGVIVGWQIILKEQGRGSSWADTLCTTVGGNGCSRIMNTKAAKGYLGIKPSDLAIGYFAVQLLSFLSLTGAAINYCLVMAAVPVTFISIYYQKMVAKEWCALCLLLSLLFWFQFAFLVARGNPWYLSAVPVTDWCRFGIILLVSLAWFPFKQAYLSRIQHKEERLQHLSKSRDPKVFQWLLSQQETIHTPVWNDGMRFGKADAPIQVTIACQPYCNPCARRHAEIETLIEGFPNDICLTLKWLAGDERSVRIMNVLFSAVQAPSIQHPARLVDAWFGVMDYERYMTMIQKELIVMRPQDEWTGRHNEWIKQNHIGATPTVFINGQAMPAGYSIDDLKIILPSLIEGVHARNMYVQPESTVTIDT